MRSQHALAACARSMRPQLLVADRVNHQADTRSWNDLDKRSKMCKLPVWQDPKKSLHFRTHTTSSNEGWRPRGAFLWVCGVLKWGRGAGF
jgi:hypothetical protein